MNMSNDIRPNFRFGNEKLKIMRFVLTNSMLHNLQTSPQSLKCGNSRCNILSTVLFVMKPIFAPGMFLFKNEEHHKCKMPDDSDGFRCDVCPSFYQRAFSLKRHYLKTHINPLFVTERDLQNCGIPRPDGHREKKVRA